MNRHAKAPSAFTHGRSAALALALGAIALLAFVPLALASKGGDSFIGTIGPTPASSVSGGQFNNPQDSAVRQSTGQVYVAEQGNHRIQRFSVAGTFERAWGVDVVTGGATGTGTLTNGSTSITSVVTTSKAFIVGQVITGTGIPAATKITAVGSGTITLSQAATASGSQELTVATDADNIPTNELQTVNVTATGGNFKLAYTTPNPSPTTAGANTTANIPFNATAAEVQTALENLANIGVGDVAVTSPNPTGGPYTVTFQGTRFADTNVNQMTVAAGSPGLTGGTATVSTFREGARVFERCTVAANCKAGVSTGGNENDKLANGALNSPRGIAIDEDTGNVYVTDNNNNRVNVYDADGTFIRSFGFDVVAPGEPSEAFTLDDERQTVTLSGAFNPGCFCNLPVAGGTFTLSFNAQTTSAIPYNATAATVDAALEALSSIGAGNVAVTGPPGGAWTIEFVGALAGTDVSPLTGDKSGLDGGSGPGSGNVAIATTRAGGKVPAYEVCPAADRCKVGTGGTAAGQFVSGGEGRVGVSPADGNAATGSVYVADSGTQGSSPKRVQKFNLDGTLASSPVIPIDSASTPLPRHVAVDAAGIVYADAIDRIFRYDPAANGGSGGFLEPIKPSGQVEGLEIDPSNGHLLVIVNPGSGDTAIQEFANPGGAAPTLFDTHMQTGTGNVATNGLGLVHSGAGDRLYVSGINVPISNRILVLDNDGGGTPPSLTVSPPTAVGTSQATLHGSVNPNGPTGFATSYRFEVSKNGVSWTPVNTTTLVGDDAVSHPVSNVATGLEANTFYRVRLVTERAFNAGATTSAELTFITDSVTPEIVRQDVQGYTDTSAVLSASVNPNGKPTSYRFEYGKTTAYGSKAPVPDGSLTGTFPKYVSEQISGLEPNTTYHYRFLATNEEGTSTGADKTFTTRSAFAGFPARAYEQVSPVDKNGYSVMSTDTYEAMPVSPDGSSATFQSVGTFAGGDFGLASASGGLWYQSRRSPTGWTTKFMVPRATSGVADSVVGVSALKGSAGAAAVVETGGSIDDGPDPHGGLYRRELFPSALMPLVKAISGGGGANSPLSYAGSTADLSHVVFRSTDVMTTDPGVPVSGTKLYELVDGEIRLVSFNTSNVPFATAVSIGSEYANPVSDDGDHIFFSTPTSGNGMQIYRRSGGTTTKLVSPSKRTPVDPSGPKAKEFVSATPDQGPDDPAMVFFTSSELLTNNANTGPSRAGKDLYRYDINSDTLVDISAESNTTNGARVQGVIGHSEDGKWVYYAALGQVIAGKGVDVQPNVYLWHDDGSASGTTKLIGTLAQVACAATTTNDPPPFSSEDECTYTSRTVAKTSRVSPDGQTLIFESRAPLTGYANGGLSQVFVYEAGANGGTGQLSCVSCRADGSTPQGASGLGRSFSTLSEGELTRSLSADRRAFFNSADALVPEDTNGVYDVYEWSEGRIRLISSGKDNLPSFFRSASLSGDDVFFTTHDSLVVQDGDDLYDVYDARVGGGIPQQNEPPPGEPCAGEACKPTVGSQAQTSAPPSTATSAGNVTRPATKKPTRCRKGQVKRKGKCRPRKASQRRKAAKRANQSGRGQR